MGDKMENDIYILEKLLENILLLRKNAGKTFTESCDNPAIDWIKIFLNERESCVL